MIMLKRIRETCAITLTDEFLSSDKPSALGHSFDESALQGVEREVALNDFDDLIQSLMTNFSPYDTQIDVEMAVSLHKALPMSRRMASDMRMWAWLAVEHAPDFVAFRWRPKSNRSERNSERYCGNRVRQTFARLWWAAELSRDGQDYGLTEKLVNLNGFQDIYEAIFGRAFAGHFPTLRTLVEMIGCRDEEFIRAFCVELGYALSPSALETMDNAEVKAVVSRVVDAMEIRIGGQ